MHSWLFYVFLRVLLEVLMEICLKLFYIWPELCLCISFIDTLLAGLFAYCFLADFSSKAEERPT